MREQLRQLDKEQLIDISLELREVIQKQETHIQALEDQIARNSRNSDNTTVVACILHQKFEGLAPITEQMPANRVIGRVGWILPRDCSNAHFFPA